METKKVDDLKDRLIVALDVPTVKEAEEIIKSLGDTVSFYKIGHQLAFIGGLELAQDLKQAGKNVFLDLKLLDIDNTIEKGVESVVKMGVDMLTIHAYPRAMRAAVKAAQNSSLCLLGVTVLTSMDKNDLKDAGYHQEPSELVIDRAKDAALAKMGGIVSSAQEASEIRKHIGKDMAIVTPGIRLEGGDIGDQKRVTTPSMAIASGASHLVVGRPIVAAKDRKSAALAVLEDMAKGSI